MFTHHGCIASRWFPTRSHGTLTATDYEGTSLSHLAPFANKLLMPRGIRAMNEWGTGQVTHYHTQVMGSYFTCCPVDGSLTGGSEIDGIRPDVPARPFDARPFGGRSLDHVCAEQLNANGLPLNLAIGGVESGEMSNFSYRTVGTVAARAELSLPTDSVSTVFESLIGGVDTTTTKRLLREGLILDLVRDDLERTRAATQSQSDKQLLEAWEQLIHETPNAVSDECVTGHLEGLGTTAEALRASSEPSDLQAHTAAMLNVIVLAAVCNVSPVTFFKFPFIADFRFLPGVDDRDSDILAHRTGIGLGGTCLPRVNEMLLAIDDWYAQQFASLVGKLDSISEGEGTILDNCAAVWFQEASDSAAINLNNIPIIQAGSCGGYFKTGVAVNVDDGLENLPNGDSERVCAEGGVEVTHDQMRAAATPPEFANAPINKYFCNLMNALGVRADDSGFAHPEGNAPVSHFGYYDDNASFGTFLKYEPLPPQITDPGEFAALRAQG